MKRWLRIILNATAAISAILCVACLICRVAAPPRVVQTNFLGGNHRLWTVGTNRGHFWATAIDNWTASIPDGHDIGITFQRNAHQISIPGVSASLVWGSGDVSVDQEMTPRFRNTPMMMAVVNMLLLAGVTAVLPVVAIMMSMRRKSRNRELAVGNRLQ